MLARFFIPDKFLVILITTLLLATFLPVTGKAADYFEYVINCAIALLFFLHGAKLERSTVIAGLVHWRLHLCVLTATFIIFPLLGLGIGILSPSLISPELYAGLMFLCILPSTVQSSIAFTSIAGGNVPAAVCAATASNIIGIFLTPLLAALFLQRQAGGVSLDSIEAIMLQLLLPFILGQIAQPFLGNFLAKYRKIVGIVDRGSIILVVYAAFSHAVSTGLWHRVSANDLIIILIVNGVLLAAILAITTYGSRLLGFNREDEITITFCGSKKTLASGVPMATVLFAGQNIGAILLPLMIFHQMQLMVCALLARHFAQQTKHESDDGGY
ncbi:bile acid:sodium symporter family protein [Microvirga sp. W0021]|uniref:Bile acid:sodium symporter family protein n=1 Tax=Hohaiivirga grylli TaxID=3133970 RepID=A0ABV0BLP7_9HYPH